MAKFRITALGSSFASGPGINPIIDIDAGRSGRNYAHVLAEKLKADLTDVSASGATLDNILSAPQRFGWTSSPPQLHRLSPETDIVTVTIGGNDIGYSYGMITDSAAALRGDFRAAGGYKRADIHKLRERLAGAIDKIKSTAPKARIYLVEYLNVFGTCTRPKEDVPLDRDKVDQYINQGQNLCRVYNEVAEGRDGVEVVPMGNLSKGHEVGSPMPWVTDLAASFPFHPNAAGHRAVAEALYQHITQTCQAEPEFGFP